MALKIIRVVFIISCVIMGTVWSWHIVVSVVNAARLERHGPGASQLDPLPWGLLGGLVGGGVAGGVLVLLKFVTQDVFEKLSPALIAIVMAMVMGYFLARYVIIWWKVEDKIMHLYLTTALVLIFGFIGISLGLTRASQWESLIRAVHKRQYGDENAKLVDTSVVIDGRIADIWQSGFLEGTLLVPRFVLKELQNIADSSDTLRRARGRRGLDILRIVQDGQYKNRFRIIEDDPVGIREVDGKLVQLARDYRAKILTNDYNLNKVAQIEGIDVLNINDLANALKPAVLPDEQMEVKIIKEGKEALQGVGYLDDGTMVVVDGGRDYVGKQVEVTVTSVLQTAAGRMIFTKLLDVVS